MAPLNDAIRTLQNTLLKELKRLDASLDDVTDPAAAQAIVREMQEVNHRIALAGSLLFTAQAAELDTRVLAIGKATRQLNEAIADMQNLQAFLMAISEFLGLVDDALDLAKLL